MQIRKSCGNIFVCTAIAASEPKMPVKSTLVLSLLFVALSSIAGATHAKAVPPKDLLQKYLDSDYRGSRLDKDEKAPTTTSVTWSSEPQDDRLIVTQGFAIGKTKTRRKVTKISVSFKNLGELKGLVYFPDRVNEEATFEVVRRNGRYLIDRPILMPHVSATSAQKYLEQKIATLPSNSPDVEVAKKSLQALMEQTQKVSRNQSR